MKTRKQQQAAPKRSVRERMRRMFGRRFRLGGYSAFMSVIVIVVAVVANMTAGALPAASTQLDMTAQSLYSLSEQTKRIAASLDKDVHLYLLVTTGNEDAAILRLLGRYEELSGHIAMSSVDPTAQPTFLDGYDVDLNQLLANSVLVDCDGRYRLVDYTDIYVTSYDMDYYSYSYTSTTEFDGENALTNAIHYVASANLPKVYTLTGHGETTLSDGVTEMLARDNMDTVSLSLLALDAVPEDASAIVIHAPTSDLGDEEAAILIAWMENGGRIALMTDYIAEGQMPNLLSVSAAMGLTVQNGLVIEDDTQMHINRYPHYLLPDIQTHETTEALIRGGYYILTPLAQGLVEIDDAAASVTFLLSTSETAYAKQDGMNSKTVEKEDNDIVGTYHVGAASESGTSKLVWFTSAGLLDDAIDRTVSGANGNLFLNALNWMCGQAESISIRAKSLDVATLTVTNAQNSFWSVVMIGMIPLCSIATGTVICIRRKRR